MRLLKQACEPNSSKEHIDSDLVKATYDRTIIDKMPCYVGWLFARVMASGDVNSCLKAHRIPTGNIFQEKFSRIWNEKKQIYFRKKTLVDTKNDEFFRLIGNDSQIKETGCYKSCDNILVNSQIHRRIKSLKLSEQILLRIAAYWHKPCQPKEEIILVEKADCSLRSIKKTERLGKIFKLSGLLVFISLYIFYCMLEHSRKKVWIFGGDS